MNFKNYILNIKGYSPKTYETYMIYIKKLIENDLNYEKTIFIYQHNSNNTKRIALSAFKCYYKYLNDDRYKNIELPKKNKSITDYLSFNEYKKIINYLENKKTEPIRNIVMVKLLFETGIRSSELLNIKLKHIYEDRIKIYGKCNKERYVFINKILQTKIKELIKKYNINNEDYFFNFRYKNLYKKINSFSKIINKNISPHMFRRGFATYCYSNNVGLFEISNIMGHENINTTKNYIMMLDKIQDIKNIF